MTLPMIVRTTVLIAMLLLTSTASPLLAQESDVADAAIVAQAGGTEPRDLEPRYKPVPPAEKSSYNSGYIFALTRGVADSTMHPAAKAPLFLFTVVLDLAFLPVATVGGFFG